MRRCSITNDGMTISNTAMNELRNATTNSSKTFRRSATSVGTLFIYTLALEKYIIPYNLGTVNNFYNFTINKWQ